MTKLALFRNTDSFYQNVGAAVAEWLSSWLVEQEDRGSTPGLATWIFRDWLSPASKSRYGWKIAKSTLILKTTNQPTNQLYQNAMLSLYMTKISGLIDIILDFLSIPQPLQDCSVCEIIGGPTNNVCRIYLVGLHGSKKVDRLVYKYLGYLLKSL